MTSEPSEELEDASVEEELVGEANTPTSKRNRKKFHFSIDMDIQLIKFVIEENPYATTGKDTNAAWEAVARRMDEVAGTMDMLPRTCRDRLERLLVYLETESPLLKPSSDLGDEYTQERLQLLEQMLALRNESAAKTGQPVVRLRVKPRVKSVNGKPIRRSLRYQNTPATPQANGATLPYILPARLSTTPGGSQVVYTYAATTLDASTIDPDIKAALSDTLTSAVPQEGEEAHPDGVQTGTPSRVFHIRSSGALDSQERSLVNELIECRRQEHLQRKEELEVRRQEVEVQKMKLDLETKQWESDRKEREARQALEAEERKLVLQFMRRTLLPNGTPEPTS